MLFQEDGFARMPILFPNHVRASLISHPHFMYSARIDIDPRTGSEPLFLRLCVIRIRHYEVPAQDQMGRQTGVGVRWNERFFSARWSVSQGM